MLLSALLTLGVFTSSTAAADLFPIGSVGYDVSFPQCNQPLPALPIGFGIIGATGGKAFTENPCLITQYAWASTSGRQPALYMNLKSPIGSNADEAATGPAGTCVPNDELCRSYNFGYKTAQHAVAYAKAQSTAPSSWWLDIETMSSWSDNTTANARVITGAIDFLKTQGVATGIYSNPSQWQIIAGVYAPGLPVWTTTAPSVIEAPPFCARGFAGGQVALVQYLIGNFDANYVCRAEDRIFTPGKPVGPVGSTATITADGDCLNVRAVPSATGARTTCLTSGTVVTLIDGSVAADGYQWQLISSNGTTGWVASMYLRAGGTISTTPTPTPVPTATPAPAPPPGTFANAPVFGTGRQALVVFNGGTVDQLEAAAIAGGATGVWAQDASGTYQLFVVRGPVFVNATFRAAFPVGIRSATALTLTR